MDDRARKVQELRSATGLTQIQLADAMKVARSTVSRWETGLQPIPDSSLQHLRLLVERFEQAAVIDALKSQL